MLFTVQYRPIQVNAIPVLSPSPLTPATPPNIWAIYNEKANLADLELIQDFNETVDTLLVFVCHHDLLRISHSLTIHTPYYQTKGWSFLGSFNGIYHRILQETTTGSGRTF